MEKKTTSQRVAFAIGVAWVPLTLLILLPFETLLKANGLFKPISCIGGISLILGIPAIGYVKQGLSGLVLGTLILVTIPAGLFSLIYFLGNYGGLIWDFICNSVNHVQDGTAIWYEALVGVPLIILFWGVIIGVVVLFMLGVAAGEGEGSWSSHRGPRGGEYRMSKSGKTKVYITRS